MKEAFQIAAPATYTEIVQASKFIGYCYVISTDAEAEQHLETVHRQHPKATHVCWAYRLNVGSQLFFYTHDAGEPRGSAGQPILHALERRRLVNTWCVVVRYFGGTKLGIGGLIRAYGRIAGKTLDLAGQIPIIPTSEVVVGLNSARVSQMYNFLKRNDWQFRDEFRGEEALFTVAVPEERLAEFTALMRAWGGVLLIK